MFNGQDLINVDERLAPPEKPMDAYNESKAKAEEMVLDANGKKGLLTVALRPAGIFGFVLFHIHFEVSVINIFVRPGDRQAMHGLYQVYERGQTHFQIGDNTNVYDWTYVGNVAKAHLLAADKLVPPSEDWQSDTLTLREEVEELINYPLPSIDITTGKHRIPTCEARPLGPYLTPPPNAEKIEDAFKAPLDTRTLEAGSRPVLRSRFEQFSEVALARAKVSPLQVAGQVFFITNGEPLYFWDFMRAVWHELEAAGFDAPRKKKLIVMPRSIGMALAGAAEWWGWLIGKEPTFTKFRVTFTCTTRWHNIEKARRVLGYEPEVGLEEGVKRMIVVSPSNDFSRVCGCLLIFDCSTVVENRAWENLRTWTIIDVLVIGFIVHAPLHVACGLSGHWRSRSTLYINKIIRVSIPTMIKGDLQTLRDVSVSGQVLSRL